MNYYLKILFFLHFSLLSFSQELFKYNPEADQIFEKGIENYENGRFIDARSLFNKCIFEYNNHHRLTASYIMLAKTEYNLKDYNDALITLREFKSKFSNSSYIAEADYILGLIFFKLNKIDSSILHLLKSFDENNNERSEFTIKNIIKNYKHINLPHSSFFKNVTTKELINDLKKNYSNSIERKKDKKIFENEKESIISNESTKDNNNKLKEKYTIIVYTLSSNKKIDNLHKSLEQDFKDGIELAFRDFPLKEKIDIQIKYIKSVQDSQSFYYDFKNFSEDNSIVAIIGPIYSEQFLYAAKFANDFGIPIISPTATGNNIASIGDFVFQANSDFNTRAKAMAIYSTKYLKYEKFAIFAPNNSYGKIMSETFSREVIKRGGKIFGSKLYESDSKNMQKAMLDLINQIYSKGEEIFISLTGDDGKENIKKLINYGIKKSYIDSLLKTNSSINIYSILGKDAKNKSLGIKLKTFNKLKYDVDDPVFSIDGIYIPINSKNDIKNIAAALTTYKINAKVIGTGDYNHSFELLINKKSLDGIIFDSDVFFDLNDKKFMQISKYYFEENNKRISHYSFYAYDALTILLEGIAKGNKTRFQLREYLTDTDYFQGVHSKISFKFNRINSYLNILKYHNNKISRIYEINIADE